MRRAFTALPRLVRAGATLLGAGLLTDLAYHATHGIKPHSHPPGAFDVAFVIHTVVALGMALCMTGVATAGVHSVRTIENRRDNR